MSAVLEDTNPKGLQLPPDLEAHEPPEARGLARDEVRLMVSRRDADSVAHTTFQSLPELLNAGDLIVFNTSAMIPAAIPAWREDGTRFDLHLSTQLPADVWIVEPRKIQAYAGEMIRLPDHGCAVLLRRYRQSRRLWIATLDVPQPVLSFAARWGRPIRYPYLDRDWPMEIYETIFGFRPGSAEMPSAGRPFTGRVLERLRDHGVELAPSLLHTGVASLEGDEQPYEEYYEVSSATTTAIRAARARHSRVVAVGTTVVRALESSIDAAGIPVASQGWTDLIVTPQRDVKVVDALLTGMHEPRSTHLLLLQALASESHLSRAYQEAIEHGYLWHEFGDVHLIL